MDLEQARKWIKSRLNEEKYFHSLGAEETARELACMFSVDPEKAAFAALIHDNAKNISYKKALELIKINNFDIDENIKTNFFFKKLIHAHVGACLAQKELSVSDEDILNAIKFHSTGRPNMSMLEKIVYIADKIESNTREPELREKILKILRETGNINEAVLICTDRTIRSLLNRKFIINTQTIEVWNSYIVENL